jgi:hypothetical protein
VPQDFAPRVSQPSDAANDNSLAVVPAAGGNQFDGNQHSANKAASPASFQFANGTQDPTRANRATIQATWWTLATTVLSIAASIAGAFVGAGPTFRLLPLHVSHRQTSGRGAVSGAA